MKTILNNRGYIIKKTDISFKEMQQIKKDLVVRPFVPKDFPQAESFQIYLESPNKLYLPRYYGIKKYGDPTLFKVSSGNDIKLTFSGKLRALQEEATKQYLSNINNNFGGGIVCLKCGEGKTVLALNIISILKKKTLVIVHKEFLANQWIERILQYLPDTQVGKIQGKVFNIEGKDICIAMLQTLSLREFESEQFNSFGLVIIDEVHHLSSQVFSRALLKVNCKYTLGLTATPTRTDGLTHVFLDFLGPIVYKSNKEKDDKTNVIIAHVPYFDDNKSYNKEELTGMGKICTSRIINNITNYTPRSNLIVKIINSLIIDKERNIILLSDRREHLKYLYETLKSLNEELEVGFYVGGMKQKLLDNTAEKSQIILSTFSMAAEALDIPKLNCLILASPKVNVEQAVGRILRKKHFINPLVIDIEDKFSIFPNQYKKRLRFYKSNKYNIEDININYNISNKDIYNLLTNIENINIGNKNNIKQNKTKQQIITNYICDDY